MALSSKLSPERVLKRANEDLEMEKRKIKAFSDGAQFYLDKGNYQLCAFVLHQVFELCYRMVEIVIFGKEKLSHSIRNHHQIALAYLPQLKLIFDKNDENDMTIMELLDSAYLSVRYENGYYVTERQLLCLIDKAQTIQEMVEEACGDMLEAFGAALDTVMN
ncbi:HEPN domain-containing protein [Parapedobacter composti]|nr:HEPN domain-containing protein [Parapedobacter composti]